MINHPDELILYLSQANSNNHETTVIPTTHIKFTAIVGNKSYMLTLMAYLRKHIWGNEMEDKERLNF